MGDIVQSIQERMSGAAPGLDISSGITNQIIAGEERKRLVAVDNAKAERDTVNEIRRKKAEKQITMSRDVKELFDGFTSRIGMPSIGDKPVDERVLGEIGKNIRSVNEQVRSQTVSDNSLKASAARSAAEKAGNGVDYMKSLKDEQTRLDKQLAEFNDYSSRKSLGANTPGSPNFIAKQAIQEELAAKNALIAGASQLGVIGWSNSDIKKRKGELDLLINKIYPEQMGAPGQTEDVGSLSDEELLQRLNGK